MNLNIMLSEVSQYHMISLRYNLKKIKRKLKFMDTENRFVITRGKDLGMDEMGE